MINNEIRWSRINRDVTDPKKEQERGEARIAKTLFKADGNNNECWIKDNRNKIRYLCVVPDGISAANPDNRLKLYTKCGTKHSLRVSRDRMPFTRICHRQRTK